MPKRKGNNPKRRIASWNSSSLEYLESLAIDTSYRGSPHHKKIPADYGFNPQMNPRPGKSLCDGKRIVRSKEAINLFREGIRHGMISRYRYLKSNFPKYIWAVDSDEEVYEAKLGDDGRSYHGYLLGDDELAMKKWVINEWRERCRIN